MLRNATLDTLSFNPFIVNENMNHKNQNPDLNFFHKSITSLLDTDYVSPKYFKSKYKDYNKASFFVLHLNTKNFESFKEL